MCWVEPSASHSLSMSWKSFCEVIKLNFKVRAKSASFWIGIVGTLVIVAQAILGQFGIKLDVAGIGSQADTIITAVFAILSLLGVAVDPTTKGIGDSNLALTYAAPKVDSVSHGTLTSSSKNVSRETLTTDPINTNPQGQEIAEAIKPIEGSGDNVNQH